MCAPHGHVLVWVAPHVVLWWGGQRSAMSFALHLCTFLGNGDMSCHHLNSYLQSALCHQRTHKSVWAAHGQVLVWVAPRAVLWWVGQRSAISFAYQLLYFFVTWLHALSSCHTSTVPWATIVGTSVCALPMAMGRYASHPLWFCGGLDREVQSLLRICTFCTFLCNGDITSAQLIP